MSDGVAHAADLAVAAFVDHELEESAVRVALDDRHSRRGSATVFQLHSGA
jgi:hypothetical protein